MKTVKPLTKKEMISLGRAIADSDIRFNKRLSQIASSLGLKLPQDEIITPAMPDDVLKGYYQRMGEELTLTGESYMPKKNYSNENR